MGITGIYNIEIGQRLRGDVRKLYEDVLGLKPIPDGCPHGHFSVGIGAAPSPLAAILTFTGSGTAIRAVTLAVARGTLANWRIRLSQMRNNLVGRAWQFGDEYLCFADDADFDLALVEIGITETAGVADQILGLRGIEVADGPGNELQALLRAIDLDIGKQEGPILRYEIPSPSQSVAIDVFRAPMMSFQPHLAQNAPQRINFKVAEPPDLDALKAKVRAAGFEHFPFCHRASAFVVRLRSQHNLEIGFISMPPPRPTNEGL